MKIIYGTTENNVDVTEFCYNNFKYENFVIIPANDYVRAIHFTDPAFGILKKIFVTDDANNTTEYDDKVTIKIDVITSQITTNRDSVIESRLVDIQQPLKLKYGSFNDELPEQKMAIRYLTGDEKILELGGNVGRNSLVIASILNKNQNYNLVSLESDENIAKQLIENRDLNKLNFHVESSALSKRKLIQKGWDTIESDILLDGYKNVNTITFNELKAKYQIDFDTLVIDCEGAFYYILKDMPEILDNIKLIIMENDYYDINNKHYINDMLKQRGFYLDYVESGGIIVAYSKFPKCYNNFFEVWKK